MLPILYASVSEGTVPTNYGVGVLSDVLTCQVTEELNGSYELTMDYAAEGLHASEILPNAIIKVKPNFTDEAQLFRIYKVGKTINGRFTVNAAHISYDLSGKIIRDGSAGSCVASCALLAAQAGNFTIQTDKSTQGAFRVSEPSSVRSWFGGKEGSLLDIYGGEWYYNNYTATLKQARGSDRGVTIRYGKNLVDLSQELDMENLVTGIVPYCINSETEVMTVGSKVSTGLIIDVDRDLAVDFSDSVDFESSTAVSTQLANLATGYIGSHNLTTLKNSITLDFVQLEGLAERVDLGDTCHIYYEALGVSASVKCVATTWDVLEERYTSTTFGDVQTSIIDTITNTERATEDIPRMSDINRAIVNATEQITGNKGGYVIIHDSDNDGEPDEILIMNTPSIDTATKVWRWNQSGLGYSSTGYAGTYGTAITADGAIVADFITAGTLSGNRVRTGLISSTNNQLQIDLDNGTITAPSITLNGENVGEKLAELETVSVVTAYALSNSGTTVPASFPLSAPTQPTEAQPYLWSRTIYTYANGATNTSYTISVRGANGQNGQDGKSFTVKGTYNTMADLIAAHPTGEEGDAYMVAGDLVVWNVDTNSWEDVGRIQGPSGFDGLWLAIENDDTGTNMNVTYTAKLYKGVTDVTTDYNAVFVWQKVNEDGVEEIAANTATVTVARDEANYGSAIRCICICIITEENLQDYAYAVIQDYSGNDIQIIGSNIVKLVGDTAIYKPYAISSQFQVLSDEISSKVEQTAFNSLSNTVTTQGTAIQQNAQAILLKADTTTVNTGLAGKMGTDMSNRSSSILIDSGQIRFDSNSLVVNSNQFHLDASGNATFGGVLSAATLVIGGSSVPLNTAIDNAETDAVNTANGYTDGKAAQAQTNAVTTANGYTDGKATATLNSAKSYTDTSEANTKTYADGKASAAQTNAINAAAADATTKANNAAKVATNYITKIDSNGIFISPESQNPTTSAQGNSVLINGNGMNVYKGNTSVASFGDTARVGKADNARFLINATSIQAYNSSNNKYFEVSANGMTYGSNTVASTAYADQAEADAISTAAADATSKANAAQTNAINTASADATTKANNAKNAAISTAESYTDTGLAGKVGNSEVRTKFAADNTSVSITSGTIAFNSNTLTVDSTNFKLTANGSATATDFNAKSQLNLVDSSNNVKARLEHTGGTGGTRYRLYDTNSNALVDLWAYNGSGTLNLNDSSGNQLVGLGANGSSLAKNIYLKNASGTTRAVLYVDSYDHGNLYLYNESGTAKVTAYGSGEVNAVKFRQTGGLTSLYNGSMTSGSTTFSAAFSAFLIVGTVKSGGAKVTTTIPVAMLTTSDTGFQIADNDHYVSFNLKVSGTTATMTFASRDSTGAIERVYGML